MAGYQTIEALRPILHRGPVATPVVDRALVKPKGPFISKKGRRTPHWIIAEMIERRSRGEPLNAIAEAYGVTRPTVVLYTRHVPPPPGGWATGWSSGKRARADVKPEFVKRLKRAGFTWPEIAEECGCHEGTVRIRVGAKRATNSNRDQFSAIKWRVCTVAGVPAKEIAFDPQKQGRSKERVSRVRMIIYWLGCRRLGLSSREVGERLGGFDRDTVGRCVRRVDTVVANAGISQEASVGRFTKAVLAAEWPKASA